MINQIPKSPYPKDPINEAVIQISTSTQTSPESLKKIANYFKDEYPHQEPLTELDFMIDATGGPSHIRHAISGYRLTSITNPDVLVVQPGGIVAARLSPYAGWEQLLAATKKVWSYWHRVAGASPISRLGVRYINRIDVPLANNTNIELSEYLNFFPQVPKFVPKQLNGYVVQATFPTEKENWTATLTSTVLTPPPLLNTLSIILDIDLFRIEQVPQREESLWECIESVRSLKNSIFESCITDKTRKCFE
jgi:uncharacterized protein (TIGR04255 family)